jgi:cell division protein FtsB
MGRKYKMTGCAKFFIVILILAPIAYFGAAYFNGEDGIQNIKDLLGIEETKTEKAVEKESEPANKSETDQSLIIQQKDKTIDSLRQVNTKLREEIEKMQSGEQKSDSEG